MKITTKVIKALDPCKGRLDNYLKFYAGKEFTKGQFMGLKNITQFDKLWVAFRLMPKESIKLAAADIAESVLSLYESKYPGDDRPRKAIEAARTGSPAMCPSSGAASASASTAAAAYAAASSSSSSYASYAAYAAACAAYAADAAAYAADAASSYASYAADAASSADAASDSQAQNKLNRKIVLRYWK